ncbi:MAG TPA: hypothetical protein VFW45_05375 [Candidatus Polarisedimenticolia bacterium]|nr:hypothetical protein [Candidatus Polarisedimenticolia bacterium]
MQPSPSHRLHVAFLLLLVLLARVPDLFYHYQDWDEAAMMSQAWAMTRGQVLYRDTFQIHPILNFAIFYPFFALLPSDAAAHAIKLFNLLLAVGVVVSIYAIGRRWTGDSLMSLLAASLAAQYLGRRWGLSSYGEFYFLLPILATVGFLFLRPRSRTTLAAVGALWATAFFIKQMALFDAAGLMLAFFLFDREKPVGKVRAASWMILGAATAAGAVALWLAGHGIFFLAMRETILGPAGHYVRSAAAGEALPSPQAEMVSDPYRRVAALLVAALAVAILAWAAWRSRRRAQPEEQEDQNPRRRLLRVLGIWLAADLLGLVSVAKFYPHYLIQLLPALTLLAAYPVVRLRSPLKRALVVLLLVMILGGTGFVFARTMIKDRGEPRRVRDSRDVAALVRAMSGPEDRIFLYRFRGLDVFYLAQRLSSNGIYMFIDMFPEHINDPRVASERQRMLLERPPRLIVTDPGGPLLGCNSAEPFFDKLLRERYCLRERRAFVEIHELCNPALP